MYFAIASTSFHPSTPLGSSLTHAHAKEIVHFVVLSIEERTKNEVEIALDGERGRVPGS